jgi:hypothetical protein
MTGFPTITLGSTAILSSNSCSFIVPAFLSCHRARDRIPVDGMAREKRRGRRANRNGPADPVRLSVWNPPLFVNRKRRSR